MGVYSSSEGEIAVKRTLKLVTGDENRIQIELEDWRSGIDHRHRRHWVLGEEYWFCVETDEIAREAKAGTYPHPKLRRAVFLRASGRCECIAPPQGRSVLKLLRQQCSHAGRCNAMLREPWELHRVNPGPYELSNVRAMCQACYRNASGLIRW